jgi:hypothetical protein
MFIAFLLETTGLGVAVFFIWRCLAEHMKTEGQEAVEALSKHLFIPLLGRKEAPAPQAEPEDQGHAGGSNGQLGRGVGTPR